MADLKLETIDPVQVAYIELRGPYENFGRGLMDLVSWLERKRVRVAGPPIGLYYDNPTETPPEKLRAEACVPIYGDVRPEGPYKVKVLSGGLVAVTVHQGPPQEYTRTYGTFLEGILKSGYTFREPAREIYDTPAATLGPGMGKQIQQRVEKRG